MKAVVLSAGFEPRTARLQPHRTLLEMGKQLVRLGHQATLVSDCIVGLPEEDELAGMRAQRVPSVHLFRVRDNPALLFIGLSFSVLFMGLAANYVARLIERYSWLNYVGLAVILWVALGMIYEGWVGGEFALEARDGRLHGRLVHAPVHHDLHRAHAPGGELLVQDREPLLALEAVGE